MLLCGVLLLKSLHVWACGCIGGLLAGSVDETTKFMVGRVWAGGLQVGIMDGSRVLELLQERWVALFRRMHVARTGPDVAWRKKEVQERWSDMQIFSVFIRRRRRGKRRSRKTPWES